MIPNTAGLQEYSTEELLTELIRRAMVRRAKQDAANCIYDDYLLGRVTKNHAINKLYDTSKGL